MITAPKYEGKCIGVFGLARTGVAAVHALVASGAKVMAWDDNEGACAQVGAVAVNLYEQDFSALDALLLAPGVPITFPAPHPLVLKAKQHHVPLISDLDVFESARPSLTAHKIVAVTGTNGKSTTTALIHHIIALTRRPVVMGGNIGTGVLALNPLPAKGTYVFELSSFQLDLMKNFKADVAVLLNITPDHLDRHGSMAAYVAAKVRLFEMQKKDGIAVISIDDEYGLSAAAQCQGHVVPVSVEQAVDDGVYVKDGMLVDDIKGNRKVVGDLNELHSLQGLHNWQNAAAAYAACRALGIKPKKVFEGLKSFPGLAHRQENVPYNAPINVVNDSKATNVEAALRALKTFSQIRWIAGGRSKDRDFSGLASGLSAVKKAYLMGEHGPDIARALPANILRSEYDTMKEAVSAALGEAEEGDTVLLSPACTAFDQYPNFEIRGDAFKAQVASFEESSQ